MVLGELSLVLINIINNAKDILVERKILKPQITVNLTKEKNFAIITIEDNAGGIPDDILNKVFDPYFTTKFKTQGTGLGLHMSKEIIENSLHGRISASNSKYGATFRITLPIT
jgi:signal transduction histidine kinase